MSGPYVTRSWGMVMGKGGAVSGALVGAEDGSLSEALVGAEAVSLSEALVGAEAVSLSEALVSTEAVTLTESLVSEASFRCQRDTPAVHRTIRIKERINTGIHLRFSFTKRSFPAHQGHSHFSNHISIQPI